MWWMIIKLDRVVSCADDTWVELIRFDRPHIICAGFVLLFMVSSINVTTSSHEKPDKIFWIVCGQRCKQKWWMLCLVVAYAFAFVLVLSCILNHIWKFRFAQIKAQSTHNGLVSCLSNAPSSTYAWFRFLFFSPVNECDLKQPSNTLFVRIK